MKDYEKGFVDYLKGYSLEEIASKRDKSINTIKSWMTRGLENKQTGITKKWTDLKKECLDQDGNMIPSVIKQYVSGSGNLSPSVVYNSKGGPQCYPETLKRDKEAIQNTLKEVLRFYDYEPVKDDQAIELRINEYLGYCVNEGVIPTVEGIANAVGVNINTLLKWEAKPETVRGRLVQNAKQCIQDFDTRLAMSGKVDRTVYIFRAKNYYHMRDQTEQVITHNNPLGDIRTPEEIMARFDNMPDEDIIDVEFDEENALV